MNCNGLRSRRQMSRGAAVAGVEGGDGVESAAPDYGKSAVTAYAGVKKPQGCWMLPPGLKPHCSLAAEWTG